MRLESAIFLHFPPFADGSISFPEKAEGSNKAEVHFLVGPNGSGKTRLLCLLAAALGNRQDLHNRLGRDSAKLAACVGGYSDSGQWGGWFSSRSQVATIGSSVPVGRDSIIAALRDGDLISSMQLQPTFSLITNGMPALRAFAFDSSHRAENASVEPMKPVALGDFGSHLTFAKRPESAGILAQSLTNIKMGAAMEQMQGVNGSDSRLITLASRLEGAVGKITGRSFSFIVDSQPIVALRAIWGGVKMSFEQLPDGLRSIVGHLAAVAGKLASAHPEEPDPLGLPVVLLLDEPEAHLHPAWQRHVVRAVQEMLPNAQIFAATHSPFVISSVNEGWIHILRPGKDGLVSVEEPRECGKGDSYLEVLQEVLGVNERFDPETESLLEAYRAMRHEVLAGAWDKESGLRKMAQEIGERGPSLRHMMGQELWQLDKLKAKARAS